jgi:hypothetical protein
MSDDSLQVVDLSDLAVKRRLMTHIGTLQGLHEVSIKPRRRTRSLDQNAYYFAAVCSPWRDWLRESQGDPTITTEQAHIALKSAVLGTRTVTNKATGDCIEIPPPSRNMKTDEFSIYIESAAKFLAEFCGIVVLPADLFFESKGK